MARPRTRGDISMTMVFMTAVVVVGKPSRNMRDSILGTDLWQDSVSTARRTKFKGGARRLGRVRLIRLIRGEAPTRMHCSSRGSLGWNGLSVTMLRGSRPRGPGMSAARLAPPPRIAYAQFASAWPHALIVLPGLTISAEKSTSALHAFNGGPATLALMQLRGRRSTPWLHGWMATVAI